jgi:hypothetical protein
LQQLTWLDRQGRAVGQIGDPILPRALTISRNGMRAAFESFAGDGFFTVDLRRGTQTRLGDPLGAAPALSPEETTSRSRR